MENPITTRRPASLTRRKVCAYLASAGVGTQLQWPHLYGSALPAALPVKALPGIGSVTDTSLSPNATMRAVDMADVHWTGGFWNDRFDLTHNTMLRSMWEMINDPNNGTSFVTFRIAAGGPPVVNYATPYSDGDCYKWLEGVAHVYGTTRDASLLPLMNEAIGVIVKAQEPDGYISTTVQTKGKKRWSDLRNLELYNMGHLMTAACVHYRATGDETLLKVAIKCADYLCKTFAGKAPELAHFSSNPSQIMGLIELYRTVREPRYLALALAFVDMPGAVTGGTDDRQDRTPLRDASSAVGHAVIGPYLYAGAADVLAEQTDPALEKAMHRIWEDVAYRKMYLTGGIGALHYGFSTSADKSGALSKVDLVNEAFGNDYELPSRTAYNETCANIANAIWNWRMLTLTADPRHAEIMERVFYNSMLSGVSLSGTEFFYSNPLRRDLAQPLQRNDTVVRWTSTASRRAPKAPAAPACCCPSNALRTMASIHEYAYSYGKQEVWAHLYGSNRFKMKLPAGATVDLEQTTDYPWNGSIVFVAGPATSGRYTLHLRIPEWAAGATLHVNGKPSTQVLKPLTYVPLDRIWAAGDRVELTLPMAARLVAGSPKIDDTRGQVAVMRGPVVYCLESVDLPATIALNDIVIAHDSLGEATSEPALLGGVHTVSIRARHYERSANDHELYEALPRLSSHDLQLKMIPYYAWANRGPASMTVWIPLRA